MSEEKHKILFVDDEVEYCSLVKEYFSDKYEVDVAHNGQEALIKVEEFRPKCVLLDIKMPKMSGVEALASIQSSHPEIPVIMVSASGTIEMAENCIIQGAFDYILKPIDLDVVENKIESALKNN